MHKKMQPHNFSFTIDNQYSLAENIGANGLSDELINQAELSLTKALDKILAEQEQIKLLNICDNHDQLLISQQVAAEIKSKYKKLYIFGIGGSSLGGQTLCGSKFYQFFNETNFELVFIDNIHYHNFSIFLEHINYSETAFLTISKSGSTIETLAQILVTRDFFAEQIKKFGADNFYFITEHKNSPLATIAKDMHRPIINHHPEIGGRYSCFLPVALIPAKLSSCNIVDFVSGGKAVTTEFLQKKNNSFIFHNAKIILAIMQKGYNNHVFMPYMQRLYQLIYWYAQLFAESLGKDNQGMMPVKALGSVDQHSLLQLFLAGPKNNFFTFITQSTNNLGNLIKLNPEIKVINYFQNNSLGDVINANQEATIETLRQNSIPLRRIHFQHFNDHALGELMMYFMLETILLGYALQLNPFDQPAVESGKIKAREILRKKNKLAI